MKKTLPLVLVIWTDAYGVNTTWDGLDEILAITPKIHSVGWLLRSEKKAVVLLPHICTDNLSRGDNGCGAMSIPRSAIIDFRTLGPKAVNIEVEMD